MLHVAHEQNVYLLYKEKLAMGNTSLQTFREHS